MPHAGEGVTEARQQTTQSAFGRCVKKRDVDTPTPSPAWQPQRATEGTMPATVDKFAHPTPLDAQVTPQTLQAFALFGGRVVLTGEQAREKAKDFDRKYVIRRKP